MQCLASSSSVGILLAILVTLLHMHSLGGVPSGRAGEEWRDPCSWGSAALSISHPPFADIMLSVKRNAQELNHSAAAYKKFLTEGGNARVPARDVDRLTKTNVTNFPHDFRSNAKPNISEVLIADYNYLSKVYIFFQQAKINAIACDTRSDTRVGQTKIQSILSKIQLTLCDVSTYLTASGHPMPADQIPGKDEVLDSSVPSMKNISLACINDTSNTMNEVNFMLARDTVTTCKQLYSQYVELSNRLPGRKTS